MKNCNNPFEDNLSFLQALPQFICANNVSCFPSSSTGISAPTGKYGVPPTFESISCVFVF